MTAEVAAVVTASALLLGYPLAYLLARIDRAKSNLLLILVLVPFWTVCILEHGCELGTRSCTSTWSTSAVGRAEKNVLHGRYVTFQLAEVSVSQQMLAEILSLIGRLRAPPAPA